MVLLSYYILSIFLSISIHLLNLIPPARYLFSTYFIVLLINYILSIFLSISIHLFNLVTPARYLFSIYFIVLFTNYILSILYILLYSVGYLVHFFTGSRLPGAFFTGSGTFKFFYRLRVPQKNAWLVNTDSITIYPSIVISIYPIIYFCLMDWILPMRSSNSCLFYIYLSIYLSIYLCILYIQSIKRYNNLSFHLFDLT